MISQILTVLGPVGLTLQVIFVVFLLSGGWRKFQVLLVYGAGRLLADISEAYVYHRLGGSQVTYGEVYWTAEVLMNLLMFLMVIVFTYQALEGNPLRAQVGRFLAGTVILAIMAPVAIYHQRVPFSTRWFNGVIQWFNFGAAIMNLGLWTALLSNKKRDPQLVKVSIGLGLAVTGAAMGFGLRQFFPPSSGGMRGLANLVVVLTHLLGVFVWCWVFRPAILRQGGTKQPSPAATSSGY